MAAGMRFAGADYGAVVTNSSYTPQAKTLASTCGVYLLHYTELRALDALAPAPLEIRLTTRTAEPERTRAP